MADYQFERESRTPYSEAYTIERDGEPVGRIDIHFTQSGVVYATLCVPASFDDDEIEEAIAEADERLVLSSEAYRDDFVVTVWRGAQAGVYSEDDDDDEEEVEGLLPEDESGNGRTPVA